MRKASGRDWMSNRRVIQAGARALGFRNAKLVSVIVAVGIGLAGLWSQRDEGGSPGPVQAERPVSRAATAPEGDLSGRVVKVSDGDTITILRENRQIKIRMLGIDAPEKSQPFGNACRETLAELVAGREVRIQVGELDRYGRTIGKVLVDGRDANLAQVEAGCAWHYKQFARNQEPADRERYAAAEAQARREKRGLWKEPAEEPWAYRRKHRG
jgi:endonuclease YncB( thermonuclease family)